jgi:hypothetical protein
MHRINALTLAAASALLAGCANPILQIGGAGFSAADSPSLAHEPQTMAESMQKLNHLRASYYEAIRQQREASLVATNGLTWLGTALIGLAYGKAASGWIVGTALVGGTTYGLTRAQLDARQVELWQQGIESLDCARRASLPLDLGADQQRSIQDNLALLVAARDRVQADITRVNEEVDRIGRARVPGAALVDEAVQRANSAMADADTAVAVSHVLLNASRGRELSSAVDRIGAQVVRASDDIAVDVSSVKQLVAGIGSFSSIFVPGIDSTLGQAISKWNSPGMAPQSGKEKAPPPVDTSTLSSALGQLSADVKTLAHHQSLAKALAGSIDTAAIAEALKGCNVAGVSTAMVLQPASLEFTEKTADGKMVSISGGTPPYEVALLDVVASGAITTSRTDGMSDRVQVQVGASAPAGTYTIAVKDSSTSHRVVTLAVHVAPAPVAPAPVAAPAHAAAPVVKRVVVAVKKPADAASAVQNGVGETGSSSQSDAAASPATLSLWTKLAASLRAMPPIALAGGASVSVTDAKLSGPDMRVVLACSQPIAPGTSTQLAIKTALSRADAATYSQLQQAGAISPSAQQIKLIPSKSCFR